MLLSKYQNKWEIFTKFLAFLEKVLTWGKERLKYRDVISGWFHKLVSGLLISTHPKS